MEEVKRTAADSQLSMEDAMRQAIKLGLPQTTVWFVLSPASLSFGGFGEAEREG